MTERAKVYKKKVEPERLTQYFEEYIIFCENNRKFPNVAGFNRFVGTALRTYYDYKLLHEKEYSQAINFINQYLEDEVVNNHFTSPAERIFYLKNKFNYADRQEIKTTNYNKNNDVKGMTDEEIKQELADFKKE